MKTNRNFLSTFDASEGTLYLIFVTTLLLHQDAPKTFGLDNVDGTLNPGLVRELTKIMVEACAGKHLEGSTSAYQAFMTSHHPSSLDSFDIFCDDQRIFVASRKKEGVAVGSTSLERLEPPLGMDREQWVDITEGRKLSVFLLEEKIPGALT
jgi:predicted ATPase